MHPDAIIAGLRRELGRLRPDEQDRKTEIEAEIERVDRLPRPEIAPELRSLAVADKDRVELTALRTELARAPKERHAQIKTEIKRVEAIVRAKLDGAGPESDVTDPAVQEPEGQADAPAES